METMKKLEIHAGDRFFRRGAEFLVHSVSNDFVTYTVQEGGEPVENMTPAAMLIEDFIQMMKDLDS